MRLGPILRQLRKERKIPLADAARKFDLSPGYLSQIERDLAMPSIQTLQKISDAFGMTLSQLFEEAETPSPRGVVVRSHERKVVLHRGSTAVNELLVPDLKGQLEVILSHIRPGTKSPVYRHAGEEFGLLLKGALALWVGEERFDLRQGDAIRFPSTVPHYWKMARGRAEMLWVITPPSW